jgi:hypothetical protein
MTTAKNKYNLTPWNDDRARSTGASATIITAGLI